MILDTQSIKNAVTATRATVDFDAGKLVKGRKHLVLIDTLGNVLASRVMPAHVSDAAAAMAFWDEVARVLGDNAFVGRFTSHLAQHHGIRFEKLVHRTLKHC